MNTLLRLASAAFLHVLLYVGITEFLQLETLESEQVDAASRFIALFLQGLGHAAGLAVLMGATTSRGLSLLAALAAAYAGVVLILPAADQALLIPLDEHAVSELWLFVGTVQAAVWLPASIWLLARSGGQPKRYSGSDLPSLAWLRFLLLGPAYLAITLGAAQVVSVRAPEVLPYLVSLESARELWGIVAGRGLVLALIVWPVLITLRGPGWVRGLMLGFALASWVASPWVLGHPTVPDATRLPLALTQAAVAGVYGLVLGIVLVKRPAPVPEGTTTRMARAGGQ